MTKHKMFVRLLFAISLLLAARNLLAGKKHAPPIWPQVEPLTETYYFPDALRASVHLSLTDASGKKIYVLDCRPGVLILNPNEATSLPDETVAWGDFDCQLHSLYSRDKYESLLIQDPLDNDESHSRGEFYFYQLQGSCLEYPEWGRRRSFKLRGMRLQLELTDIRFAAEPPPGRLASFGFKVEVSLDPSALSALSEPPPFLRPAGQPRMPDPRFASCDNPVPQHVPGILTEEYVRRMGFAPPYPVVGKLLKKIQIDPSREGYVNPAFFTTEPPGQFAQVKIEGRDGKPAYDFECVASRIVTEKTPQIAGKGLTCGLFIPGKKTNLLLDSVDPYSRMTPAIVLPSQLQGAAANDPEWGSTRHFSLRGFRLTLTFESPVFGKDDFGNPTLVRSKLTIEVEPDANAKTPVSKTPSTPYMALLPEPGDMSNEVGRVKRDSE